MSRDETVAPGGRRIIVVTLVSGVLLLAGILLAILTPVTIASFGWFAYAPLSAATFVPGLGMQPGFVIGLVLGALGLLGIGFGLGWLFAVRRGPGAASAPAE